MQTIKSKHVVKVSFSNDNNQSDIEYLRKEDAMEIDSESAKTASKLPNLHPAIQYSSHQQDDESTQLLKTNTSTQSSMNEQQPKVNSISDEFCAVDPSKQKLMLNTIQGSRPSYCYVCMTVSSKQRCAQCKSINYCSKDCQLSHWKYHKTNCKALKVLQERFTETCKSSSQDACTQLTHDFEKQKQIITKCLEGKVGLYNLGNSCYLNSSLQCLSHIKPLSIYFMSQRFKKDLNCNSKDGTKGVLAEQYYKLISDLWFDSKPVLSPHSIKTILGKINPDYAGLSQQDAHEVIELFLDKLHEDVNRVVAKPYIVKAEGDGSPANDQKVAHTTWVDHTKREDSQVKDICGGLMKSKLTCPDCGKVSVSFEYHNTLQVAIPRSNTSIVKVIFIPEVSITSKPLSTIISEMYQPIEFELTMDRLHTVGHLKEELKQKIPSTFLQNSNGLIHLLESDEEHNHHTVCRILKDSLPILKLLDQRNRSFIFAYCPIREMDKSIIVLQRLIQPRIHPDGDHSETTSPSTVIQTDEINAPPIPPKESFRKLSAEEEMILEKRGKSPQFEIFQRCMDIKLVGIPLLISIHSTWSAVRVRYAIWLNMVRFFVSPSSETASFDQQIHKELLANDFNAMIQRSLHLPFRMVDIAGLPLTQPPNPLYHRINQHTLREINDRDPPTDKSSYFKKSYKIWKERNPSLRSTVRKEEQEWLQFVTLYASNKLSSRLEAELGVELPKEKSISIESFLNPNEGSIPFISVDLESDLLLSYRFETVHRYLGQRGNGSSISNEVKNSDGMSLSKCLEEHTKEEILDEGNEWYCSQCKSHKAARKIVKFWKPYLPSVLILSLKRFEFRDVSNLFGVPSSNGSSGGMFGEFHRPSSTTHREKIDTFVDFLIDGLDLAPYCDEASMTDCCSPTHSGEIIGEGDRMEVDDTVGRPVKEESSSSTCYDLFAVCNHYGRMGFGHYTASCRDLWDCDPVDPVVDPVVDPGKMQGDWMNQSKRSKWYNFDDDKVSRCNENDLDVKSSSAYLLFYKRRSSSS